MPLVIQCECAPHGTSASMQQTYGLRCREAKAAPSTFLQTQVKTFKRQARQLYDLQQLTVGQWYRSGLNCGNQGQEAATAVSIMTSMVLAAGQGHVLDTSRTRHAWKMPCRCLSILPRGREALAASLKGRKA